MRRIEALKAKIGRGWLSTSDATVLCALYEAEIAQRDSALRAAQLALELDESDCAYAPAASDALDLIAAALAPTEGE